MLAASKPVVALYVDKTTRRWIVRDSEGKFWSLPSAGNTWDERQPFIPAAETELQPVPGHSKYMLGPPH
jgi:hypothetical protein